MRRKFIGKTFCVLLSILFLTSFRYPTPAFSNELKMAEKPVQPTNSSPTIEYEDVNRRGMYEKHFKLNDGSYAAVSYEEPIHYKNGKEWKEIDNTLLKTLSKDGTEQYNVENGLLNICITNSSKKELVTINNDDHSLSWTIRADIKEKTKKLPLDTNKNVTAKIIEPDHNDLSAEAKKTLAKKSSSFLKYKNIIGDSIDIQYSIFPTRLKEDIILNKPIDIEAFYVDVKCPELHTEMVPQNRTVRFLDSNHNVQFIMETPYMVDAAGVHSENISVTILKNNTGRCTIAIRPDQNWLNSETRVYPVTIDPAYYSSTNVNNIIDNYVCSGTPNTVNNNGLEKLYIGNRSGKNYAFIRHINMPTINKGVITYAKETLYLNSGTSTAQNISVYMVQSMWQSSSITWNNMPKESGMKLLAENVAPYNLKYEVDITNAVLTWYNGSNNGSNSNYGIMVRYYNQNISDYNSIYSGDYSIEASRPKIMVQYLDHSGGPPSGTYFIRNSKFSYYLDVYNGGINSGTNVINFPFNASNAQIWNIQKGSDGYYTLEPAGAPTLRLDVYNSGNQNGSNLQVYNSHNGDNQKFQIIFCGVNTFYIVPKYSITHVLDGQGGITTINGTSGANVHLWEIGRDFDQQRWVFENAENSFNENYINSLKSSFNNLLGSSKKTVAHHYTPAECINIIMQYDATITYNANFYKVPKSVIQTLLMRELWCVNTLDDTADSWVIQYYNYKIAYEQWSNQPIWLQLIIPVPEMPLMTRTDSSTGLGQIFAETAIGANNMAVNKGIIKNKYYNNNDWHDMWDMWSKLKEDNSFNIKMVTLEIINCAIKKNLPEKIINYSESQMKSLLSRYNGTGNDALLYGEECYSYYLLFRRFNQY